MDIYLAASQQGKYPPLATSNSVNSCLIFQLTLLFVLCVPPGVDLYYTQIPPAHLQLDAHDQTSLLLGKELVPPFSEVDCEMPKDSSFHLPWRV